MAAAESIGIPAHLVTPYSSSRWLQRLWNLGVNIWRRFHTESAHLWLRRVHRARLRCHLRRTIGRFSGRQITVYAQDPLSAAVALEIRGDESYRVVSVAHFNRSESIEFADKGITRPGGQLWRELVATEEHTLPAVDQLIFVSEYMRRQVCARIDSLEAAGTLVIPNFCHRPVNAARNGRPRRHAVSIGSLEPRKNQQFLIRVIAECKRRGFLYNLDIVGSGNDRPGLEALANSLGVQHQIRFLGLVRDAADLIPNYLVLLHAATMESFGIVLIEALATGTPVFARPVGGVREIFQDGMEGVYWDASGVSAAATQLIDLLDDRERYLQMRVAAAFRFETRFDPARLSERWLDAIMGPVRSAPRADLAWPAE